MRLVHFLVVTFMLTANEKMTHALTGKTALVTGSTDGIGLTTAKNLAAKGFNILIHGRDNTRIERAVNSIRSFVQKRGTESDAKIFPLPPADISTVGGCMQLVDALKDTCEKHNLRLTVLMNNAGVFSEKRLITADGLEQTFAVNVLAPFIITSHALKLLLQQKSRIVIASSISQCQDVRNWKDMNYSERPYSAHSAYSESKLLDAMLTLEFAQRLKQAGFDTDRVTCNCLDPGTVNTKMLVAGWGACGIDVQNALGTFRLYRVKTCRLSFFDNGLHVRIFGMQIDETWLCTADEVENVTGKYFVGRSQRNAARSAYNEAERRKLWEMLARLAPDAAKMWNFDGR